MAASIMLSIPFLLALARSYQSRLVKGLLFMFAAAGIWTIVITGSRSGMVTLIIALTLIAWFSKYRLKAFAFTLLTIIVVAIIMPAQYTERFKTIFTSFDTANTSSAANSARGRLNGLRLGIMFFLERPLTGVGAANFARENRVRGGDFSDAHNLLGKLIGELGAIGLLTFGFFLFFYIKSIRRAGYMLQKHKRRFQFTLNINFATKSSLVLLLAMGLFGHNLYRFNWYLFAAFVIAILNLLDNYNIRYEDQDLSLPEPSESGTSG
jgi:O-antigen ligase